MGKEKHRFQLKVPKGTKDWAQQDAKIRKKLFATITNVFDRHGCDELDTPTFELKEILAGKYGEDSKLIYDLQDQGGELCSLRYDLTVPFARWLAMNPSIKAVRRYQIGKVFRRDQPAMTKGRMREFYQCDFDIAGDYDSMLPDAKVLRIACEVFRDLGWNDRYTIKLNHRKILDGMFAVCGVPEEKFRTISSAVDKLDKVPWEDVKKEMTEEKGLDAAVADKIGTYVSLKGGKDLLEKLMQDEVLMSNTFAKQGLEDMQLFYTYLDAFKVSDKISFDLSLARGLDYYTGVIYEIVTEGSAPQVRDGQDAQHKPKKSKSQNNDEDRSTDPTIGVGSVAAGGRYDNLVGMFSGKAQIPCVGVSFGIERIFSLTKSRLESGIIPVVAVRNQPLTHNDLDVFVMAFGGKGFTGMVKERIDVCTHLWDARIKADFLLKVKAKLPAQFKAAEAAGAPFGVIIGEDELAQGKIKIKEMGLPDGHPEKEGVMVDIEKLVPELRERLQRKEREDMEKMDEMLANQVNGLDLTKE